jgi:signal transduction histidine kinase
MSANAISSIFLRALMHSHIHGFADWCLVCTQDGINRFTILAHADPRNKLLTAETETFAHANLNITETLSAQNPYDTPIILEIINRLGGASSLITNMNGATQERGLLLFGKHNNQPFTENDKNLALKFTRQTEILLRQNDQLIQNCKILQSRQKMIGSLSHDLKNPLCAIKLNIELLIRLFANDTITNIATISKSLTSLQTATTQMQRLITNLLDLHLLENNQMKINQTTINATDAINETIDTLLPIAAEKRLTIRHNAPPNLMVHSNQVKLQQILSNLTGNAIKFSEEQGQITIEATAEQNCVRFSIHDSGPGIPEDELPHIFEPYWHGQKNKHEGTGLGLAIAMHMVTTQGGRIWAENRPEKGVSFHFTLPNA